MIKLTAKFLFLAVMLCSLVAFGCGGGATTNNTPANNAANNAAKKDTPKTDAPKTDAPKTESAATGVPECDEYIEKYEACLTSIAEKYPQVHPNLKQAFETQRKGFKDAAANPDSKATLASTCKQAIDTAKQATSAYACKW